MLCPFADVLSKATAGYGVLVLIGRARRSDGRQTGLRMGPIGRCMLHATAGAHEACRRLERILVGARRDLESLGLFVVAGGAQQTA